MYRFDAVCHCTNPYRSVYLFWFSYVVFFFLLLSVCHYTRAVWVPTYSSRSHGVRIRIQTEMRKMDGDRVRLLNFIYMILIALFMVFCDDSQNRMKKKGETSALSNSFILLLHEMHSFVWLNVSCVSPLLFALNIHKVPANAQTNYECIKHKKYFIVINNLPFFSSSVWSKANGFLFRPLVRLRSIVASQKWEQFCVLLILFKWTPISQLARLFNILHLVACGLISERKKKEGIQLFVWIFLWNFGKRVSKQMPRRLVWPTLFDVDGEAFQTKHAPCQLIIFLLFIAAFE